MKAQKCLACGDTIALRKDGDLATCLSCGSSYVRKKETLEKSQQKALGAVHLQHVNQLLLLLCQLDERMGSIFL